MQLQVKGKGMSVTDALFQHAEQKLERLAKVLPPWDDATSVELELSVERNPKIAHAQIAEVTVRTKGPVLRVREAADDMYVAIDVAARKLERQARRYRDKRRRGPGKSSHHPVEGTPVVPDEDSPLIVKTKQFPVKPMSPEEAVLQLELVGHDFFVFQNAETIEVNVVYRRRDGNYGLIEPQLS